MTKVFVTAFDNFFRANRALVAHEYREFLEDKGMPDALIDAEVQRFLEERDQQEKMLRSQ